MTATVAGAYLLAAFTAAVVVLAWAVGVAQRLGTLLAPGRGATATVVALVAVLGVAWPVLVAAATLWPVTLVVVVAVRIAVRRL